jgi:hypothetical protein
MIAALVWKEYREHRAIWLAMAGFSALFLTALAARHPADRLNELQPSLFGMAAVFLCWAYGVVCGGMLLAGEAEEGTPAFLDTLPTSRRRLWSAKCLMGVSLVLGFGAALALFRALLGYAARDMLAVVGAMVLAGLTSLGWGLLFSARGERVLHAIAKAIGAQVLAGLGLLLLLVVSDVLFEFKTLSSPVVLCEAEVMLGMWAFGSSRRIYCATDRLRLVGELSPWSEAMPGIALGPTAWLCQKQMRLFAFCLMAFSLAGGVMVTQAGTGWCVPITLVICLSCGLVTFHGEKGDPAAFRFLGDQRFPLAWVWLVKTRMYLLLATTASLVVFLPAILALERNREIAGSFESSDQLVLLVDMPAVQALDRISAIARNGSFAIAEDLRTDSQAIRQLSPGVFLKLLLSLMVLHGIAAGQLGALLFRRTLPAIAASLVALLCCVGLWLVILVPMAGTVTVLCQWLLLAPGLGQFCGLLFRNTLFAVTACLGMTVLYGALTAPTLVVDRLSFWQIASVPLLLMAMSFALFAARAGGRPLALQDVIRLGAFAALAASVGLLAAFDYR